MSMGTSFSPLLSIFSVIVDSFLFVHVIIGFLLSNSFKYNTDAFCNKIIQAIIQTQPKN